MKIPTCSPREDSRDRACVEIEVSKLKSEDSRDREISKLKSENSRNRAIELSKLKNENSRDCVRVEIELAMPVGSRCSSESCNHTPLTNTQSNVSEFRSEDSRNRDCVETKISKPKNENSRDRGIPRLKNENSRNRAIELPKMKNQNPRDGARVGTEIPKPKNEISGQPLHQRGQMCVCACVHVCVRACMRARARACTRACYRLGEVFSCRVLVVLGEEACPNTPIFPRMYACAPTLPRP